MGQTETVLLAAGVFIASTFYLLCTFVLGVIWAMPLVSILATASFGFAFLGYVAQLAALPRLLSTILVLISWATAITAGIVLLLTHLQA